VAPTKNSQKGATGHRRMHNAMHNEHTAMHVFDLFEYRKKVQMQKKETRERIIHSTVYDNMIF
jgi:hypothetical protein